MAHIWKTGSYFFPLLYICLLCDEVLLPWNFRLPGFDIGPPPQDPQIWKIKYIFFHTLDLNLKIAYQIVSLFDMYIDMGERIAGKQDRPSLIMKTPPQGPLNSPQKKKIKHFGSYMNCCIWWHFGAPGTPGFYVRAQHDPKIIKKFILFLFIFYFKTQKVFIISWYCF